MEDLAGILPCCLVRLPNVNALKFHCQPCNLPQDKTRVFINTVVAALRYVPLLNLTALDITFPITHYFGQLFCSEAGTLQIPIQGLLRDPSTSQFESFSIYEPPWTTILEKTGFTRECYSSKRRLYDPFVQAC